MALPNPNQPISMSMIQAEFGGAGAIELDRYYRGGARVYDCAATQYIPTAGTISVADFWSSAKPIWVGAFSGATSGTKTGFSAADGFGTVSRVFGTFALNYLYYDSATGLTYFDTSGSNGVTRRMTKGNPRIAQADILDGSSISGVAFDSLTGTFELCIWTL